MSIEQAEGQLSALSQEKEPTSAQKTMLYQELCNSYHNINDFRTKILGFLPLASGAGIFYLLSNSATSAGKITQYLLPIGMVGAIVTFGLFIYDLRAIQIRHEIIKAGKDIEKMLQIRGQFSARPPGSLQFIHDLGGSTLIYSAVIAGWIFFGLAFSWPQAALPIAIVIFIIPLVVVVFSSKNFKNLLQRDKQESTQQEE